MAIGGGAYNKHRLAKAKAKEVAEAAERTAREEDAAKRAKEVRERQEQEQASAAIAAKNKEVEDLGKAAVLARLRDPNSAEFRRLKVVLNVDSNSTLHKRKQDVVCGEVNAKNGLGGYAGFVPFVWASQGPGPEEGQPRLLLSSGGSDTSASVSLLLQIEHDTFCK